MIARPQPGRGVVAKPRCGGAERSDMMRPDTKGGAPHMTNETDDVTTTIATLCDSRGSGADPVVPTPAPPR
jgi:hypothetical protein